MNLYKFDLFRWITTNTHRDIPLKDIMDIDDPVLSEKLTTIINAKKKQKLTSLNLECTYVPVNYSCPSRNNIVCNFRMTGETKEEAADKVYLQYVLRDSVMYAREVVRQDEVKFKGSKLMPNAPRDSRNPYDFAIERLKKCLINDLDNYQYTSISWKEKARYFLQGAIQEGVVIPDFIISPEELAVQTALGQLPVVVATSPIKLNEDVLTITNTPIDKVHPNVIKAIETYNESLTENKSK